MVDEFRDHNVFDRYAWENGHWAYDNGWPYMGKVFSAYVRDSACRIAENRYIDYFLLLREDHPPYQAYVLHGHSPDLVEVWSGEIKDQQGFDVMMTVAISYIRDNGLEPASG